MKFHTLILLIILALFSCKKDPDPVSPTTSYTNGIFIINEGQFLGGNGSISFYHRITGHISHELFKNHNYALGDVVSSMTVSGNKGFIVVNNSQKVEVVTIENFKRIETINNFSSPRHFLPLNNNKGYVTDWISNVVAVLDLNTYQIVKTIPAGTGPEQMTIVNDKLYVTNVGGFTGDSTVTIINTTTDTVLKTITVGRNPNSIIKDKNGFLWILCNGDIGPDYTGGTADDIAGELIKLNPANDSIESRFVMNTYEHPLKLIVNASGDKIYYLNGINGYEGKIYSFNINDNSLPLQALINKAFYGFNVDPVTNNLLGAFVPNFTQKGYMFRYTDTGNLIDSVKVGIAPNGFAFN